MMNPDIPNCKQLYKNCYISGTVDFIFGGAAANFIDCEIRSRYRPGKGGFITAAATPKAQTQGYVFENCYLTADSGVENVFLGRPWRNYAQTAFKHCYLGEHIVPEGWNEWDKKESLDTIKYEEIHSINGQNDKRPSWVYVK